MPTPPCGPNQRRACNLTIGDRVIHDGKAKTVTDWGGYAPWTRLVFDGDPYDWTAVDMMTPFDLAEGTR